MAVVLAVERVTTVADVEEANVLDGLFGLHLAVVDDNKDAARMLGMVVRMLGNEVRTAGDGQEALEVAAEFLPELVIMDIGMPVMNGYEAAKIFRQKPWGQSMVIVALTGWGQDEDRNRTREAGFDYHLVKPVDPAALQKLLDGHRTISGPAEVPSPLRPLA